MVDYRGALENERFLFIVVRKSTNMMSKSAWVRSWPLFGGSKNMNMDPRRVFLGVLGESWRHVAAAREAIREQNRLDQWLRLVFDVLE